MKKAISLLFASIMLVVLFTGCGEGQKQAPSASPPQAKQENVTLKLADSFPITHIFSKEAQYFIKRVEELTNGQVKIEYYPAEQLGKVKDLLNLASQGVVDLAYVSPPMLGQVPLNTVMVIPEYTTATQGSEIYRRMASGVLMPEFQKYGVRPVLVYTTPQYDLGTTKKSIKSPADLKGLKIRTPGGLYTKIAERYGITPVTISPPEIFEAEQRGVIEGSALNLVSLKGYKLNEIEKYHTLGASFGGMPLAYVINEKKWQQLSPEIQKALLQAGDETSKHAAETMDSEQEKLAKEFEQQGMTIVRLTPEEQKKWREPLKGIEEVWIESVAKEGLPAKEIYQEFHKLCQEVVK